MTEENEKLEFDEQVHSTCERNPTVWTGSHINVHKGKDGGYFVHLKKTELSHKFNPHKFAKELLLDMKCAKEELGL